MTSIEDLNPEIKGIGRYQFGWSDSDVAGADAQRGLSEDIVRDISSKKSEPQWMLDLRLKGLKLFRRKPMPTWGAELDGIDFENIKYFVRSSEKQAASWEDLPEDIKNTYDRLGIPEAEKQRLVAGVAAQYESEVVYHSIREDLEEQGVIFVDTDTALRAARACQGVLRHDHPVGDNKFAALNTSVWSGGSFIYVPRASTSTSRCRPTSGSTPRTWAVRADPDHRRRGRLRALRRGLHGADLLDRLAALGGRGDHRQEGRPLPLHDDPELVQQLYNLVTKRAICEAGATMEWVDGNIGSKVTMKYPAIYLMGEHAKGESCRSRSPARASTRTPAPRWCTPPPTRPAHLEQVGGRGGGRTSYRGLIQIDEGAYGSVQRAVRRAARRPDQPLRHLPLRRHPRGRRVHGSRGLGLEGLRGPAVLPDVTRAWPRTRRWP